MILHLKWNLCQLCRGVHVILVGLITQSWVNLCLTGLVDITFLSMHITGPNFTSIGVICTVGSVICELYSYDFYTWSIQQCMILFGVKFGLVVGGLVWYEQVWSCKGGYTFVWSNLFIWHASLWIGTRLNFTSVGVILYD